MEKSGLRSGVNAFYYARVIEILTPRWKAYEALRFNVTVSDKVLSMDSSRSIHYSGSLRCSHLRKAHFQYPWNVSPCSMILTINMFNVNEGPKADNRRSGHEC
jgi:hypothetical protein